MTVTVTKRVLLNIVLGVFCVILLLGAGIANYVAALNQNVIKVNLTAGETESIKFKSLSIDPDESREYRLKLNSDITGACVFTVSFSDEKTEDELKNYARASVEIGGNVVADGLLAELFKGESIRFKAELSDGKNEIKVKYYIPDDVGNEAQNAEASLEMYIKVENE